MAPCPAPPGCGAAWPRRRPTRWDWSGVALRERPRPRPHPSPLCVRPAGAAERGGAEGSNRGGAGQAGVSRGSGRDSPPLSGSPRPLREPARGGGGPGTDEAQAEGCRACPGSAPRSGAGSRQRGFLLETPCQGRLVAGRGNGGASGAVDREEHRVLPWWTCRSSAVTAGCHWQ